MKLTTIVAGCDLSDSSDQAVERAASIAAHHGARLLLVHVQGEAGPKATRESQNALVAQLEEVSAAVRVEETRLLEDRRAAIAARGIDVEVVVRIGSPDETLATLAEERGAELIVVGTHGHTGLSRFLLGSVAASVIRHAKCDVLVVRGRAPAPFQRPLVATDFTQVAGRTIEHAAALCMDGAPLDVIHAWQLPAGSWGATLLGQARFPWSAVRDAVLATARDQADKLTAKHPGIRVELAQGPASQVITEVAERDDHDLIAIGAHGLRGVRRLLLGSVAESTVRHAACSVLVVHVKSVT